MKKTILILCCAISYLAAQAQWSNDPTENYLVWPEDKETFDNQMAVASDGTTWLVLYHPQNQGMTISVQAVDTAGVKKFGEEGLMISNYSNRTWTSVNDYILVDDDDNVIIVVSDTRNSPEDLEMLNYSVYKISPEGEFLWGEEGIAIDGSIPNEQLDAMRIVQLEDGSYVFAWARVNGSNNMHFAIEMQRLDKDGNLLWNAEDTRLIDDKVNYQWPWLVNAGNNQCILVYARGSNQDLYARKVDFDGSSVWAEDTRIYRGGGFGNGALHTLIDVQPANGGVIVSWNDDRDFDQIECAYVSYVKPNGELGFTSGMEGQRLSYSGMRAFNVKSKYDAKTNTIVSFFRENDKPQNFYSMMAQRLSMNGELLWGENGLTIEGLRDVAMSYNTVQNGREGEMALFYMTNEETGTTTKTTILDVETGNPIWSEGTFSYTERDTEKTTLQTTRLINNNFFVTKWFETIYSYDRRLCMQRINYDRTIGSNGLGAVNGVKAEQNSFSVASTIVTGDTYFTVNASRNEKATLTIYDLQGRRVATPFDGMLTQGSQYVAWSSDGLTDGVYIATLATQGNTSTIKLIIQ